MTKRQREVLDYLIEVGALSSATAHTVFGEDNSIADNLASAGVINKRYAVDCGEVYWIRADSEPPTGVTLLTGFSVVLNIDLTTPGGKKENFFLARAWYDGKSKTFRVLLRDWMKQLNLRAKDLISLPIEIVPVDSAIFRGDHVILDEEGDR
jgi:hypothetical protein